MTQMARWNLPYNLWKSEYKHLMQVMMLLFFYGCVILNDWLIKLFALISQVMIIKWFMTFTANCMWQFPCKCSLFYTLRLLWCYDCNIHSKVKVLNIADCVMHGTVAVNVRIKLTLILWEPLWHLSFYISVIVIMTHTHMIKRQLQH